MIMSTQTSNDGPHQKKKEKKSGVKYVLLLQTVCKFIVNCWGCTEFVFKVEPVYSEDTFSRNAQLLQASSSLATMYEYE